MAFENHHCTGLLERASRIAVKHDVVYSAPAHEFRGAPERVLKATAALEKWMHAEASIARRSREC